ncbi:MAG: A24 family peptidase [Nanoarchaeota archaeon]|nr:A24 family peptidase [Nanoarchaeota archaeon]
MPLELFFALVIMIVLLIGSYTDLKTREVPDWVNFSFIISAVTIRGIWSVSSSDWSYIIDGIFGLVAGVALAYTMFYAGQWGGGDAKMMMGLGAMIGLQLDASSMLVSFLFNTFLVGAVYALAWGVAMVIKNWKAFKTQFTKLVSTRKVQLMRTILLISAAIMIVLTFFVKDSSVRILLAAFVALFVMTFYLWLFVRAIEKSCMLKMVPPEKLTEGDWIAKDVYVGKKRITGPKDLGISKEQIAELIRLKKKRKIKEILIKEGIPFVPSFLLAFIATWIWGNLFLLVL